MHGDLELIVKIIELITIVGGGGVFIFKMGRAVSKFEEVGRQQGTSLNELKIEVKSLATIMTKQALQDERITNMTTRLNMVDKNIDELRHGNGFVFPLGSHVAKP